MDYFQPYEWQQQAATITISNPANTKNKVNFPIMQTLQCMRHSTIVCPDLLPLRQKLLWTSSHGCSNDGFLIQAYSTLSVFLALILFHSCSVNIFEVFAWCGETLQHWIFSAKIAACWCWYIKAKHLSWETLWFNIIVVWEY